MAEILYINKHQSTVIESYKVENIMNGQKLVSVFLT
jgi:hypothetical protein